MTSPSLSALLDNAPSSPQRSNADRSVNAHTVAGDENLTSENDGAGEVIIRDGKKVRRVKRVAAPKDDGGGQVYRRADGKLVRKVPKSAMEAGASGTGESETYRRADGKLVVRKKVVRRKSFAGSGLKSTKDDNDDSGSGETGKGDLAKLLDGASSSSGPKRGSSKSVGAPTARRRASIATPGALASSSSSSRSIGGGGGEEGEVYRRADGKMVRRVVVRRKSEAGGLSSKEKDDDGAASGDTATTASTTAEAEKIEATTTKAVAGTKSAPTSPTRKTPTRRKSGVGASLAGLFKLGSQNKKGAKSDDSAAAATVSADGSDGQRRNKAPARSASSSSATTSSQLPSAPALDGFLDKKEGDVVPKNSGAATVTGVTTAAETAAATTDESRSSSAVAEKKEAGNVYINKDGKKVRKVKRAVSGAYINKSDGEVYRRGDGKLVRRVQKPAPGAPSSDSSASSANENKDSSNNNTEGEVYRRADGMLVRRVKRSVSGAYINKEDGEVYRRSDGKLVRRVQKPAPAVPAASSTTSSNENKERSAEGEVYRRDDGQLVRRVKRNVSGAFINKEDGEVYRRSDGKLVRRVQKTPSSDSSVSSAASDSNSNEGEVYRRADGKLVRRVRRTTSSDSISSKDSTAAESVSSTDSEVKTVRRADGRLVKMVKRFVRRGDAPKKEEDDERAVVSQLSPADEQIAQQYRKMREMGMPDDAVKHKMTLDDVSDAIQESVLNHEVAPTPSETGGEASAAADVLTADEEAEAAQFRKMLKMGLPPDVVRQKMQAAEVSLKIIHALVGAAAPTADGETPLADGGSPATDVAATERPDVSLTGEEEEVAGRFRKMLAIGLSEEAVRSKMQVEGVDPKIIYAVAGGDPPPADPPGLSAKEEETVERFRKMLRTGIPEVAVRNKMASEGLDERMVALVMEEGAAIEFNTAQMYIKKYEDIAKKFNEMLNSGESLEIVRRKMVEEGHNEKLIAAVLEGGSLEELAKEEAKLEGKEGAKEETGPSMFEVEVHAPPAAAAPAAAPSGLDPSKQYAEVGAGKEVVDSKLADAARAVSVLGDLDMQALLDKLQNGDMEVLLNKLKEAEKRQKKLEKQLAQAGIGIAEDIDYNEAKVKVEQIAKRMAEIGGSDAVVENKEQQVKLREEYFKLEQEMERFNTALVLTDEYQQEQDALEQKWENDNAPINMEALQKIRRHMPVKIRFMSEADLTTKASPNGKYLPKEIAKKFKRTNVLQCLRVNPEDMERMHPSTLENMRVTGLTLTERRALYAHLRPLGPKWEKNKSEKMTERKWTWYNMMKNNFKENVMRKQRPTDKVINYDGDYGWPDGAVYEVSEVKKADVDDPGAKAMQEALEMLREKKANERGDILKKHYKGKLLQVSKANGSCESMDEAMDRMENHTMRWMQTVLEKGDSIAEADKKKEVANFTDAINELKLSTLGFAQRSGMQLTGKKKAGGDAVDIRSTVEGGLAEEVIECSTEFFGYIRQRIREVAIVDSRINTSIESIEGILNELHDKNLQLLRKLGVPRPARSRKLKKNSDLKKEVIEKKKEKEEKEKPAEEAPPRPGPPGGGGRGGLLDAIQKGRGPGRGGGRGGLLDAIAARGRGGRGGRGGGRAGLLDAIKGRG